MLDEILRSFEKNKFKYIFMMTQESRLILSAFVLSNSPSNEILTTFYDDGDQNLFHLGLENIKSENRFLAK